MKSIRTNPTYDAPEGDESLVCMVFDGETGNGVVYWERWKTHRAVIEGRA